MVDQRSWVHVLSVISRGCVWEIDLWVLPALLQRLKRSACQCSDHTPHTASNWSAWLSFQKEASSKDDAQESPQTFCWRQAEDTDYWNYVMWSDETKINLFGSVWSVCGGNKVRGTKRSVSCLESSMSAAGTVELQFIDGTMNANMYCDILKQSTIPSLWRLGHRARVKVRVKGKLRVKVMDCSSMSPDLNPI